MARIQSQAIAGYYPTPVEVLNMVSDCIVVNTTRGYGYVLRVHFFDPCAGEGEALNVIRDNVSKKITNKHVLYLVMIELESERAARCAQRYSTKVITGKMKVHDVEYEPDNTKQSLVINANAFNVELEQDYYVPPVICWLNPPYDFDPICKRVEESFLVQTTAWVPKESLVFFVVPYYALNASARTIAKHYKVIDCFKFPEPHYQVFKQVILVLRRKESIEYYDTRVIQQIEQWSKSDNTIKSFDPAFRVSMDVSSYGSNWVKSIDIKKTNIEKIIRSTKPLHETIKSVVVPHKSFVPQRNIDSLLQHTYPVAVKPKPAHIVTAIASGVFNGSKISPNKTFQHLPDILVKGVFEKQYVDRGEKRNREGKVVGMVQEQEPSLSVTVFDLKSMCTRTLQPGGIVNERLTDIASMTTADLIHYYSEGLLAEMFQQCPVLYDQSEAANYIVPRTKRKLYHAQSNAVRALTKLFETQQGAILLGEIGCGKSTVSLLTARMNRANRILVLCPPHLLESWQQQYKMIFGYDNTMIIRNIDDVHKFQSMGKGALGIMSRESAKLDYEKKSLMGICPKCGFSIKTEDHAKRRSKCTNQINIISKSGKPHPWTQALLAIARIINPLKREHELICALLPQRVYDLQSTNDKYSHEERIDLITNAVKQSFILKSLVTELVASLYQLKAEQQVNIANILKILLIYVDVDLTYVLRRIYELTESKSFFYYSKSTMYNLMDICISKMIHNQMSVPRDIQYVPDNIFVETFSKKHITFKQQSIVDNMFEVLQALCTFTGFTRSSVCNEPLYYATDKYRRISLSTYIAKNAKQCFDFLIIDEGHEYATDGSAQEVAAHRLMQLGKKTLLMTGSIMNGYASSLFTNMWYLSYKFRQDFVRDDIDLFVDKYGYKKQMVEHVDSKGKTIEYSAVSDMVIKRTRKIGIAPGVLPLMILKYLLPISVTLQINDLNLELKPVTTQVCTIEPTAEQLANYKRMQNDLVAQIQADMFTPDHGKLWGQMSELPSYMDRAMYDYNVCYPKSSGGKLVTSSVALNDQILPKEQWMIDIVKQSIEAGDKVILFTWHVVLLPRLKKIVEQANNERVAVLDSKKVPPHERQQWIENNVLESNCKVLILNPVGVKTGINNLVSFNRVIWFENPACNPEIYRQAIGRVVRIGQQKEVNIYNAVYAGTLQEYMNKLLNSKVIISMQTDGLSVEAAIAASGADDNDVFISDNIGKLMFDLLTKKT